MILVFCIIREAIDWILSEFTTLRKSNKKVDRTIDSHFRPYRQNFLEYNPSKSHQFTPSFSLGLQCNSSIVKKGGKENYTTIKILEFCILSKLYMIYALLIKGVNGDQTIMQGGLLQGLSLSLFNKITKKGMGQKRNKLPLGLQTDF